MAPQNKLVRFKSIDIEDVFEKESKLLKQVQSGKLSKILILWQAKTPTLVLPSGKKWRQSDELITALQTLGWHLIARKTGGAPVPQLPGIINLSYIYPWPNERPYDIKLSYQHLCSILTEFFISLGIKTDIHATPHSYCDGDYNLNIKGKKVVGTAQRVVLNKDGSRVVLSQACILVDAVMPKIVEPVNLCNQLCGYPNEILADVHTTLFSHTNQRPCIDSLFQTLTKAFIDNAQYL